MANPVNLHDGSGAGFIAAGTGFILAYGPTTPGSGARGYAKGCVFSNQTDGLVYRNAGTKDSSDFVLIANLELLTSATVPAAGTTIACVFSEAVSGTEGTGWTVSATGGAVTVSSGSGSGTDTITLTLSRTIESGEIVTLDYSPGDIVTVAGSRPLAAFSGFSVTNVSTAEETIAPTFVSANIPVAGTTLVVNFSENVVGTEGSGWTITASGGACTVSSATGTGTSQLTLTLSRTIAIAETVTLDYSSATGDLADEAANDLATFTGAAVANDSTHDAPAAVPDLTSAAISSNGTTLTLGFSGNVTKTDATGLSIEFDNFAERVLTYASGSGTDTLLFTISANPTYTEVGAGNDAAPIGTVCTLTYAGAEFVGVTDFAVTNNSTVIPDPDLPEEVDTELPDNWDAVADHTPANGAALQAVLDAWTPGAAGVIELTAGVDYGFITWPAAATGSADNWIIVRTSEWDNASWPAYETRLPATINGNPVEDFMPTISRTITGSGQRLFTPLADVAGTEGTVTRNIRFIGINWESRGTYTGAYSTTIGLFRASNTFIGFDRCRFWWQDELKPTQGIATNGGTDIFVIDSRFDNYYGSTIDNSPIWIYDGSRVLVHNNYIQCNSNGLFLGDNNFRVIEDITYSGNHITRPATWSTGHGTQKAGGFEAKTGLRVLVEENRIENTFSNAWQAITVKAEGNGSGKSSTHFTIRWNKISSQGTGQGIAFHVTGSSPGAGVGPNHDCLIEQNLIYDNWQRSIRIIGKVGLERVQVIHNTALGNGTQNYQFSSTEFPTPSSAASYHVFRDNITGGYVTTFNGATQTAGSQSFNIAWGSTYSATHNVFFYDSITRYDNDTDPTPLGTMTNNAFPSLASVGFVDSTSDNYRLTPGSTYSSTGASPASDSTDRGCDVDALETIMAGVVE
jgi:hypothetical protein